MAAFEHERVQRILARAEHAAGIDQLELRALPLGRLRDDIARRAGNRRDDRAARAGEPIEKRRFSDVRTSDEDDGRQAPGISRSFSGSER